VSNSIYFVRKSSWVFAKSNWVYSLLILPLPIRGPAVDTSSSDTGKVLNIADILLQARDLKTGKMKVFVEWEDRPLIESSWILLTSLNKDALQWWHLLKEARYPFFKDETFQSYQSLELLERTLWKTQRRK